MKCPIATQESAEVLLAYCSHKLDPDAAAMVEQHIRACAACGEFARRQASVWKALDTWEAAPVSPDFDRRLYQRIEKEVSWWDLLMRPFRPLLFREGLPIAAAAVVVIAAGVLIERPDRVPAERGPVSAQVEAVAPEQAEHALQEMEIMREFNRLVHADATEPKM
jgi:anti-sigma factor RsiW